MIFGKICGRDSLSGYVEWTLNVSGHLKPKAPESAAKAGAMVASQNVSSEEGSTLNVSCRRLGNEGLASRLIRDFREFLDVFGTFLGQIKSWVSLFGIGLGISLCVLGCLLAPILPSLAGAGIALAGGMIFLISLHNFLRYTTDWYPKRL